MSDIPYKVYFTTTVDDCVGDVTVVAPAPYAEPFDPAHHEDTRDWLTSQGYAGVQITWRERIR